MEWPALNCNHAETRWPSGTFWKLLVVAVLALCGAACALAEDKPFGLTQRQPWNTSRLIGSPEPPLPYAVEKTFTKVTWKAPIYVADEPGTDRLWVSWLLSSDRVQKRIDRLRDKDLSPHETEPGVETIASLPLLVRAQGERPELADLKSGVKASACLIEIPYNITALKKINAEAALAWRKATRAAFLAALESGLTVEDFIVTDEQNLTRWFYKLTR